MPKFRKAPDGAWPGYPDLKAEDITHESFKAMPFLMRGLVENRMGRAIILMPQEKYQNFLKAVKARLGNTNADNIDKALHQAIDEWLAKGENDE